MPRFLSVPWDFDLARVPACYERMPSGAKFTSVGHPESEIVSNFSVTGGSKYLPVVWMIETDVIMVAPRRPDNVAESTGQPHKWD
jgi:hypothetical protein